MKISLNWLKEYIDLPESTDEICHSLTMTGLEVEGLEAFESIRGGLEGIVIGEVLTCEQHPNADRLKVTTVDIGADQVARIVCGAPNVAAGQKVVVAKTGTTLYPKEGDPLTLKKIKIRGEVSEGMICAEDELGLGEDHSGILVLDTDLPNGTPASEHFEVFTDEIIEIGLTPNRGDATSHVGVARDLKAVYDREVRWPSVEDFSVDNTDHPMEVIVENTEACPRYSGVVIDGVRVGESPEWLKARLRSIDIGPINNIVDITNFICHELGQPLHAFDAGKITSGKVVVKTLEEGTPFVTLDEEERKLKATDLMICDADTPMCIGGVFGGLGTGVTENTTCIFLESAYFSPDYIRRTVQEHGLKTDASFRFERGTDPSRTVYALKRAAMMIKNLAGGKISSEVYDIYPREIEPLHVPVKYAHIDRLIGKKIDHDLIHNILRHLDIDIDQSAEGFTAIVPPYRSDVTREADVIEEVLRIYGFNNVEVPDHDSAAYISGFPEQDEGKLEQAIGGLLAANGFYEILTNSLTNPEYTDYVETIDPAQNVTILNKLSEELSVLRQTNLFNGLEVIAYNLNRRQNDLKLFEFGKNYFRKRGKFTEKRRLSLYMTGNTEKETWRHPSAPIQFHDLAGVLQLIIRRLSRDPLNRKEITGDDTYDYGLRLELGGKEIASLGKVKKELSKRFDIKPEIFYAEIEWDLLLRKTSNNIVFKEISRFPEVRRDLSLVIDKAVSFEEIRKVAENVERRLIKEIGVFDVYEGDRIEAGKKAYALSFILQDNEKTLTDKIIDKTMKRLMQAFQNEIGAYIRQ